jgi:Rad3-related DNA helicase
MPIEVSKPMVEYCFSKIPCAVLVSGTLSTAHNFNFIKNRLGLDSDELETKPLEGRFASPFSYENQTRLFVPTDLPDPSDPLFAEYITTP